MASLEPELLRPKTVTGKQEVVLPKQLNEILEQSQKVPKHLESVPQQSTNVLEQLKQVPQKSMELKQEIKRSEKILEMPNNAVPQPPNEKLQQSQQQSTDVLQQPKQVPQESMELKKESKRSEKILEMPNNAVPQQPTEISQLQPNPVLKKKPLPTECLLNGTGVVPITFSMNYGRTIITEKTWRFIGKPKLIKTKVGLYFNTGDRIPTKGIINVRVVDVANGEKGIIPMYVGEEYANLKYPLYIGTSGQTFEDFQFNSLFIDEKTEECLTKKGASHWMKSKIGRKKLPIPVGKGGVT